MRIMRQGKYETHNTDKLICESSQLQSAVIKPQTVEEI